MTMAIAVAIPTTMIELNVKASMPWLNSTSL
jgi:hypothetical protein